MSFIRFQCILLDSGVPFSDFWNFYKLKRGDLISEENQFCRRSELFGPPFAISILKVLRPKFFVIHYISIYSVWFTRRFLRLLKFLQIKDGGPNFWWEPILQKVWIIWSPLLYFNFKSFKDPNSLSYMRTLLFFRWYIVLSYLSVPWESLIVFLLKDAGDSLLHLSAFFCIERLSSTRLLDIVLIITILFFIFTVEFSRRYSYDRFLPGYVVNLQVWMLVLKWDFNKLTMKFSWNYISTRQQSNGFALYF